MSSSWATALTVRTANESMWPRSMRLMVGRIRPPRCECSLGQATAMAEQSDRIPQPLLASVHDGGAAYPATSLGRFDQSTSAKTSSGVGGP